jgi:hypothetical protein
MAGGKTSARHLDPAPREHLPPLGRSALGGAGSWLHRVDKQQSDPFEFGHDVARCDRLEGAGAPTALPCSGPFKPTLARTHAPLAFVQT